MQQISLSTQFGSMTQRQRDRGSQRTHHSYAANGVLVAQRQPSPHRLLALVHGPEGEQFRGEVLALSRNSRLVVIARQGISLEGTSLQRLQSLIYLT